MTSLELRKIQNSGILSVLWYSFPTLEQNVSPHNELAAVIVVIVGGAADPRQHEKGDGF